jgi:hypothetical protein
METIDTFRIGNFRFFIRIVESGDGRLTYTVDVTEFDLETMKYDEPYGIKMTYNTHLQHAYKAIIEFMESHG